MPGTVRECWSNFWRVMMIPVSFIVLARASPALRCVQVQGVLRGDLAVRRPGFFDILFLVFCSFLPFSFLSVFTHIYAGPCASEAHSFDGMSAKGRARWSKLCQAKWPCVECAQRDYQAVCPKVVFLRCLRASELCFGAKCSSAARDGCKSMAR